MKKTNVLSLSGARMLHPKSCGSSIRYAVNSYNVGRSRSVDLNVCLTDCDRGISWRGYGDDGIEEMEEKLSLAIITLGEARNAVRIAGRHYQRLKTRKGKSS